jgi:hypothetical protein
LRISELTPIEELRADSEPERCEGCGAIVDDWQPHPEPAFVYSKLCPSGLCLWVYCKNCDLALTSFGAIDCPYCGSLGRHPRISRMRHLYRVKRRHW